MTFTQDFSPTELPYSPAILKHLPQAGWRIDYFFVEEEEQKLTENTPVTVYMRTIIDTQKKLIQDQEERIKNLEKIVELREEEMTLYKNK